MKKLLIGLLFAGFTSLNFGQAASEDMAELALEGITLVPANLSYLSVVSSGTKALKVIKLQRAAAAFDITKAATYNRKALYHEFRFDQEDGHLFATYDQNGMIMRSYETYEDVILMPATRNRIYDAFPEWQVVGNRYKVFYQRGKASEKVYKLKLSNGNQIKRIKCDPQGNIL